MKRFKTTLMVFFLLLCMISFVACFSNNNGMESVQEFEFHFYPEEYEEEYNEVSKTLTLEADKDYLLKVDASCKNGTMEITVLWSDEKKVYSANSETSLHETLSITANTAEKITITVSIMPETKGSIVGSLCF